MIDRKQWVRITTVENIPLREGRSVRIGERDLAVFNLGGRFLAVANRCPHRAGPLADGIVCGTAVVCPLHAWKVELETGAVSRPAEAEACVQTFRVRVDSGVLLVELPCETWTGAHGAGICAEGRDLAS